MNMRPVLVPFFRLAYFMICDTLTQAVMKLDST